VIDDGAIAEIGRELPATSDEVLDATGLWAVPGLIDTHVHLELVSRDALPVFLANGVTTIRDLGGALDFLVETKRILDDGLLGPRLLFSGPMIDGEEPTWPALVRTTANSEAAVAAVDEHLAAGADAIKLYTTLEAAALRRCIERVAGRVPVTGHLSRTLASEAMEAGINGLEHALLTPYNDFAPDELRTGDETMMSPGFWQKVLGGWLEADLDSDSAKRWFELLAERDVSFCPTLTVVPGAGDEPSEEELGYVPQVEERWLEATRQRAEQPAPPQMREHARRVRHKLQELVRKAHEAGGRIVAGTDTGAVQSLVPGFALHREIQFLADAGLSGMDVLRSATALAARAIGCSDLGTIEPGKLADLLLLGGNPLEDVRALADIRFVVREGNAHRPSELLG
jgi:hypothetical protein